MQGARKGEGEGRAAVTARVLLVDDHPIVRTGFAALIALDPSLSVCGEAADAAGALDQLRRARPDVVLLDLGLRGAGGLELIRSLKAQDPNVKILVVSMFDEDVYADRALRAGAVGFVGKHEAAERLLGAIRQVMAGHLYLSATASDRALRRMVGRRSDAEVTPLETLSDREIDVFERIGRGLGTREIARELNLSVKTVETHRERIKTKLDLKSSTELIAQAVRWRLEHRGEWGRPGGGDAGAAPEEAKPPI
jgi:DNA-binding NarL/FixJ family response regulator